MGACRNAIRDKSHSIAAEPGKFVHDSIRPGSIFRHGQFTRSLVCENVSEQGFLPYQRDKLGGCAITDEEGKSPTDKVNLSSNFPSRMSLQKDQNRSEYEGRVVL